jgi:hypothetical protein
MSPSRARAYRPRSPGTRSSPDPHEAESRGSILLYNI